MKQLLLILLLFIVSGVEASDEQRHAARVVTLQESFRYAPPPPVDLSLISAGEPAVVLEKLVVSHPASPRRPTRPTEFQSKPLLEELLFWRGKQWGSKDFGRVRADFGTWFTFGNDEVGTIKERNIYVKIEVLRLKW